MIQISINLIVDVCGSFEEIEPFNVYMTNIAVIAAAILVLKCSLLKKSVALNNLYIFHKQSFSFQFYLGNSHYENGREIYPKKMLS